MSFKFQVSSLKKFPYAFLIILSLVTLSLPSKADTYLASDSIYLLVACYDTTIYPSLANPDSVWFYRYFAGAVVDSMKVTSTIKTGIAATKIKVSNTSNATGYYSAFALVYKGGKKGAKTWNWKVGTDSITAVGRIQTNQDKSDYSIASGQIIARADSVTGVGRITTNLDKSNYQLASGQTIARADSLVAVNRLWNNQDKNSYGLASGQVVARADSVVALNRLWNNLDTTGYLLSQSSLDAIWNEDTTGHTGTQFGALFNREISLIDDNPWDNPKSDTAWGMGGWFADWWHDVNDDSGSGSGTGANPDTIANHVWVFPTRTLTSGAGTGANQVIIRVKQSSDSAEIVECQVQVLNKTQTSTLGLLSTNADGKAAFALNSDTLCVRLYKPGWIFTVPETLKVNGNKDTTYYGSFFNPGNPPSANLCRVYGWVKDINNLPLVRAKIQAKIENVPLRSGNALISPYFKETETDSAGYWYLDLYPNSSLSPDTTQYNFFIYGAGGTILKSKATVPNQSSWELVF
jgi:hypothetical protein